MQVKKALESLVFPKGLYVLMICLWMPLCMQAAGKDAVLWSKANAFYGRKQYDSAGIYYRQLLQKYPKNAVLQYNMGNVCYRLNKVGPAVLHYQKAAVLDPGNKHISDNLLLAKNRVQNAIPEATPIFFVRWWNGFMGLFNANTWAVFSLLVFAIVLGLIWYASVKKERFAHSGRWLSLSIVCLIICGCMTWLTHEAMFHSGLAVIQEPATTLFDTPKHSGKVLGSLPEGTVIELSEAEGNFVNVRLPNGREGWVLSAAFEKV